MRRKIIDDALMIKKEKRPSVFKFSSSDISDGKSNF